MNDLDTLRPEVREALKRTDATVEMFDTLVTLNRDEYDAIRAELLRLAGYEQAAGRLAIEKAEFRQRAEQYEAELASIPDADEWDALRERAEKAEADLASLKATIADAPCTLLRFMTGYIPSGLARLGHDPDTCVHLVVEK